MFSCRPIKSKSSMRSSYIAEIFNMKETMLRFRWKTCYFYVLLIMEVKQFRATHRENFTTGVGTPFLPNKCSFCAIYVLLFKRLEECICSDTLAEPSNFRKLCTSQFQLRPSPPPPGNCGAFARIVSPGGRALAYPRATPGLLTHVVSDSKSKRRRFYRKRPVVCH